MVPHRGSAFEEGAAPRGLVALRTARPPPLPSPPEAGASAASAPDAPPRPELRCGRCGGRVDVVPLHGDARCSRCHHHVRVPRTIAVACDSCGHSQAVPWAPPRSFGAPPPADIRRCKVCGRTLVLTRVILPPRHPKRKHHGRPHVTNPGDGAAWTVLVLALTLIITVLSVTIL